MVMLYTGKFYQLISVILIFVLSIAATPVVKASAMTILYVKPQATGGCSSWLDACDLQTALAQANPAAGDQVEIWVAKGLYTPTTSPAHIEATFTLKNNVALYGGFLGNPSEAQRADRDWKNNKTVLSGDIEGNDKATDPDKIVTDVAQIQGANAWHVVETSHTDSTAILDGFVITAGYLTDANSQVPGGAGLHNYRGNPTIRNSTFSGNKSTWFGGGMHSEEGAPTLTNLVFIANFSRNNGAGLYFTNGQSTDIPTMINLTFINNHGEPYCTGAGAFLGGYSHITLNNVRFTGNSTYCDGCTPTGGGLAAFQYGDGWIKIINGQFSGNYSSAEGGGIWTTGALTLVNVTITGNKAGWKGGGIFGMFSSVNSILWGNTAPIGPEFTDDWGSHPDMTYTDYQQDSGVYPGAGNLNTDPKFVAPVDAASAPTTAGDYHLQAASPVIDAGNNAVANIATDLDGQARKMDVLTVPDTGQGNPPIVDLGAFEVAGVVSKLYLPVALRK